MIRSKRMKLERKADPNIKRVRELRENYNITQTSMAEYLGICPSAYHYKEQGDSHFSLKEAKMIAMYFNTNIEDLFFEPILNAI